MLKELNTLTHTQKHKTGKTITHNDGHTSKKNYSHSTGRIKGSTPSNPPNSSNHGSSSVKKPPKSGK